MQAKCGQALAHGLTPLLCVGEPEQVDPEETAALVVSQARSALLTDTQLVRDRVVLAYEPYWAIGAAQATPGMSATRSGVKRLMWPQPAPEYSGVSTQHLSTAFQNAHIVSAAGPYIASLASR